MHQHYWTYCELCGWSTVICGICGNNTCNEETGKLKNGLECHGCAQAYKKRHREWHEQDPKFKHPSRIRTWRNF